MACDEFKTYSSQVPLNVRSNDHKLYARLFSEQWFDDWPRQLLDGGMTCEEAREYIRANWQTLLVFDESVGADVEIPRVIVKAGTEFALCTAINYGSGGGIFETLDLELHNLTEIGSSTGPGDCTPSSTYIADGTWGFLIFGGFVGDTTTWTPTVEAINVVDIDAWFCCRTTCCGGPIPIGGAPGFLIPRPANPTPVEEKVSTPILHNPLYLSNHTYQFQNNFGVIKK